MVKAMVKVREVLDLLITWLLSRCSGLIHFNDCIYYFIVFAINFVLSLKVMTLANGCWVMVAFLGTIPGSPMDVWCISTQKCKYVWHGCLLWESTVIHRFFWTGVCVASCNATCCQKKKNYNKILFKLFVQLM